MKIKIYLFSWNLINFFSQNNFFSFARPRLETFEKIVRVESADKRKSKLLEDVLYFKNTFIRDNNKNNKENSKNFGKRNFDIDNNFNSDEEDLNFNLDFYDEEEKPSPRSRFFSA